MDVYVIVNEDVSVVHRQLTMEAMNCQSRGHRALRILSWIFRPMVRGLGTTSQCVL
jgi:hypothetical protein